MSLEVSFDLVESISERSASRVFQMRSSTKELEKRENVIRSIEERGFPCVSFSLFLEEKFLTEKMELLRNMYHRIEETRNSLHEKWNSFTDSTKN